MGDVVDVDSNRTNGILDVVKVAEAMLEKQTLHLRLLSMWCFENEASCV